MATQRTSKQPLEFHFHISLLGTKPAIWRRFRVPDNITFNKLHEIIQIVMGWQDYHLFEFKYGPIRIGIPDGEFFIVDDTHWDARRRKLSSLRLNPDDVLTYTYDFGDNWIHLLHLEHFLLRREGMPALACLEGERACPPEDVGGNFGYAEFLSVIADPADEEYTHMMEWSGGDFDPERFDIDAVNGELRDMLK